MNVDISNIIKMLFIDKLDSFLSNIRTGIHDYKTIHNLTEEIKHEYNGRFIAELIQNAHDALSDKSIESNKRRVEFNYKPNSSEFGTLYIANDGIPFTESNFLSISSLGLSSKNPDESIGNKGIGFRSVLEICNSPHIYSKNDTNSNTFDGYCFLFSRDVISDINNAILSLYEGRKETLLKSINERITDSIYIDIENFRKNNKIISSEWLKNEINKYLSPYLFPIPINKINDENIIYFEKFEYSSVIALPLKNQASADIVIEKLKSLDKNTMLFLDRATELIIKIDNSVRYIKREIKSNTSKKNELYITENDINRDERYWQWTTDIDLLNSDGFNKIKNELPEKWQQMRNISISICVKLGDKPDIGYYSVYLPTMNKTGSAIHINSSFKTKIDRKDINLKESYNNWLLNEIAEFAINIIQNDLLNTISENNARAIIDIITPINNENFEWMFIIKQLSETMQFSIKNDAQCFLGYKGWCRLRDISILPDTFDRTSVITVDEIRKNAKFQIFHKSLDSRMTQIRKLLNFYSIDESKLLPTRDAMAETIETIIHNSFQDNKSINWFDVWSDLVLIYKDSKNIEELKSYKSYELSTQKPCRIILGSDNKLHSCKDTDIFFQPGTNETDLLNSNNLLDIPSHIREKFTFINKDVYVNKNYGSEIIDFLKKGSFVNEFTVNKIFEKVLIKCLPSLPISQDSESSEICKDILDYGLRLIFNNEQGNINLIEKLYFPCNGGWIKFSDIILGTGWSKLGDRYSEYLITVNTDECQSEYQRMLLPPDNKMWSGHGEKIKNIFDKHFNIQDGFSNDIPGINTHNNFDDELKLSFMEIVLDSYANISNSDKLKSISWICNENPGKYSWYNPSEIWYISPKNINSTSLKYSRILFFFPEEIADNVNKDSKFRDFIFKLGVNEFISDTKYENMKIVKAVINAFKNGNSHVTKEIIEDSWKYYNPKNITILPEELIVLINKKFELFKPTPDTPAYYIDRLILSTNELNKYPQIIIHLQTALDIDMKKAFINSYKDSIRCISDSQEKIVVNDKEFNITDYNNKFELLSTSEYKSVIPITLTLLAYYGQYATVTTLSKTFADNKALLLSANVLTVSDIHIIFTIGGMSTIKQSVNSIHIKQNGLNLIIVDKECKQKPYLISKAICDLINRTSTLKSSLENFIIKTSGITTDKDLLFEALKGFDIKEEEFRNIENDLNNSEDIKNYFITALIKCSRFDKNYVTGIVVDIDFNDIHNAQNTPVFIKCFKELRIDVDDYNSLSPNEPINLIPYYKNVIKNLVPEFEIFYKVMIYKELLNAGINDKKKLVEYFGLFNDKVNEIEIINSIHFSCKNELIKKLGTKSEIIDIDLNTLYFKNETSWKENIEIEYNDEQIHEFLEQSEVKSMIYYKEFDPLNNDFNHFINKTKKSEKVIDYDYNSDNDSDYQYVQIIDIPEDLGGTPNNADELTPKTSARKKERTSKPENLERIGNNGEKIVYEKLKSTHDNVTWVSENAKKSKVNSEGKDGLGYDIEYIDKDGNRKFVEVKSSEKNMIEFYMSDNEFKFAINNLSSYELYFVMLAKDIKDSKIIPLTDVFNSESFNSKHYKIINKEYKVTRVYNN